MRVAKLKRAYNLLIIEKMLFIFETVLVFLFRWIHLVFGQRCVLGLVLYGPHLTYVSEVKFFYLNMKASSSVCSACQNTFLNFMDVLLLCKYLLGI